MVTRFCGLVTELEFTGLYRDLLSHEQFEPGIDEVSDLRDVSSFHVSTRAFSVVAAMNAARLRGANARSRILIVAPGTFPFGLSRMYQGISGAGPQEVHVFRQVEGAAKSLNLRANDLERVLATARQ